MSRLTQDSNIDRLNEPKEMARYIAIIFDQLQRLLNNGLGFADNFDAKIVSMTFSSANADTTIGHNLSRVPSGYVVLSSTAALSVYNGSRASTAQNLTLRANATGTVSLLIF